MSYAVNLSIKGRPALVVGGGNVATRKVTDLLDAGASVTVVTADACLEIREYAENGRIVLHLRPYSPEDVRGTFLVIAATDDEVLNARISQDAQALGILINVVDRPALCTFILPAIIRRGDFKLTISTEGQCPALASVMREELDAQYGGEYERAVHVFGDLRRQMIQKAWSSPQIREAVRDLYKSGLISLLNSQNRTAAIRLISERLGASFRLPDLE